MQAQAKTTSVASAIRAGNARSLATQLSVAERFQTALFLSATLHAVVLLGLQLRAPQPDPKLTSSLNVVLVNSKSETRPDEAQALAQANLDGGGNTDEDRMAKSPVAVGDAEFKDAATPPPPSAKAARKSEKRRAKPPVVAAPVSAPAAAPAVPARVETPSAVEPQPAVPAPAELHVEPQPKEEAAPELQAIAQQEAQARERVVQLEREARELMTQLKSERSVEQPGTTFTVPPDYQPRPVPAQAPPNPAPERAEPADRAWPPSPPPSAATTSSARVVKAEPQNAAAPTLPSIQAPPREERPARELPQPAVQPQVSANSGLRPTPRVEEVSPPEPEIERKPTLAQAPPPKPAPPPPEAKAPVQVEPPPQVVPQPQPPQAAAKPEVKIVKLENQQNTPEPPELRPQPQAQAPVAAARETPQETPVAQPPKPQLPSAAELLQRSSEIARLEAQIAKSYDEYQKRPRRKFIGARTAEFRFAQYIEEWRAKVERVGNTNYPEAAKQRRIYGSLQLTVAINSDGMVESVEINRSSGQKVLDAAAIRIVELAGPYAQFPADISKDTDILHITRTWTFTRGDQLVSE